MLFYCDTIMNIVNNITTLISLFDISVIISILKYKNIDNSILVHCHDLNFICDAQKMFSAANIRNTNIKLVKNTQVQLEQSSPRVAIVVDTECNFWQTSFSFFDKPFLSRNSWVLKTNNISRKANVLSSYPIEFNSDLTLLEADDIYKMYEFYNTGFYKNGNFYVNEIKDWNKNVHLYKRSKMLSGVNLKITVVYPDPLRDITFEKYLNIEKKFQVDSVHKFKFFTLMTYLRDMYNFTYTIQRTTSWGYVKNGSFDGLVGALQRKESDIGGTSLFFRRDRLQVVDYAAETWGCRICFIFRHPRYPGGNLATYTRPLATTVWWYTIALLLLIGPFLYIILKIKVLKSGDEDSTPSLSILFLFSALSQQGMSIQRKSSAVKITMFITFMFTLTLYQYYNAMIVSTLLREPPKTIRTLKDLLHSNIKIGVEDVIYNKDYFKRTTDPVAKALYHQKVVTATGSNFYPPIEGMKLVKAGGFAFHVDTIIAYPTMRWSFTEAEICETQEVYMIPPQKMAAILQKNSPYRKHVSYGIRKMQESGLMHRLQFLWDERKPACIKTPDTSVFSVKIQEFATPLIIVATGMLLSTIILMLEIVIFRIKRRNI